MSPVSPGWAGQQVLQVLQLLWVPQVLQVLRVMLRVLWSSTQTGLRAIGDSGCGGLAGSSGGRRCAHVSSCIRLSPDHRGPCSVTGPGVAVSGVSSRVEELRSAAQGYLTSLSPLGGSGPGTLHVPVLSTTSTCTHRVAAGRIRVPACTLVSLPPPQDLSCPSSSSFCAGAQPGGPLWEWAEGAHLLPESRAGAQGRWVPQESRHQPWMLPTDLVPHPGHAEVGTAMPPSCRGVFAARPPRLCPPNPALPFTPELPSPQFLRSPRREGGTVRQREVYPSVFHAPAAGAGQGRGLRVSQLRG